MLFLSICVTNHHKKVPDRYGLLEEKLSEIRHVSYISIMFKCNKDIFNNDG